MQCITRHERLVSATAPFTARKEGTPLVMTEHGIFLDDFEGAHGRERSIQRVINQLNRRSSIASR